VIDARRIFAKEIAAIPPEKLIFIDEFGTHTGMTRTYGRAPRGERTHGAAPCNTDPQITLTMGVRLTGVVAPFAFEGATDGLAFHAYVEGQLAPELAPGDVVVLDNLGAHKVVGVRTAIEAVGARVMYLPPYSPDLSPVENCGSKVKEILRGEAPRSPSAVYQAMGLAISAVSSKDARGWFGRCGYCPKATCVPL
jgi:transposase